MEGMRYSCIGKAVFCDTISVLLAQLFSFNIIYSFCLLATFCHVKWFYIPFDFFNKNQASLLTSWHSDLIYVISLFSSFKNCLHLHLIIICCLTAWFFSKCCMTIFVLNQWNCAELYLQLYNAFYVCKCLVMTKLFFVSLSLMSLIVCWLRVLVILKVPESTCFGCFSYLNNVQKCNLYVSCFYLPDDLLLCSWTSFELCLCWMIWHAIGASINESIYAILCHIKQLILFFF